MTEPHTDRLMEEVLRKENLSAALKRVVSNKGAAGVDGMTVDELAGFLRNDWSRIRKQVETGTYVPSPVRQVKIPKPNGGQRNLGIPTVLDRLLQQAALQVMTPIYEPRFSEHSHGFRPNRSAHGAVLQAQSYLREGRRWVVDLDIEAFFDKVNHDVLMGRIAKVIHDKKLLKLLRGFLAAGVLAGGLVSPRCQGTPQGGPLSPLLSNILLDELDKELERRGHSFVRYADDCNIYVCSEKAGLRVMNSVRDFLEKRLRLRLNEAKSAVARPWHRAFLGFSFTIQKKDPRIKPSIKALQRFKQRVRKECRRGRGRNIHRVIQELNPFLRGWANYYRISQTKQIFGELDGWVRRKLRCILWVQWKRPRTRALRMCALGLSRVTAFRNAFGGHGKWWNAGARHMQIALPKKRFEQWGLESLSKRVVDME